MAPQRVLRPKPLFDEPSLRQFLFNHDVKEVHMGKIWKHMMAHPECPLDEIPLIPEKIRGPLKEEFVLCTSTLVKSVTSSIDGTIKLLIRLQDGGEVEAVLIHHSGEAEHPDQRQADRCGQRDTLCISSQVGCRLGCTFCATGTMGLQGNLWAGEIQEQLWHARSLRGVSNVVYMGMGEPLENFDGVVSSIRGLIDPYRFGLAPSGITVSTVGILANMRRLMKELPKVKLAVSLHAPSQELREQIVPIAKTYKIEQLLEVVDEYAAATTSDGKRKGMVMVSYVLLDGVNDSIECAEQLRDLVVDRPVIVNLIPYNPFEGNVHAYQTPSAERVDDFLQVLVKADIRVFERRHHGRDIAAACGQLAKISSAPVNDIENCSCTLSKERVRGAEDVPSRYASTSKARRHATLPWNTRESGSRQFVLVGTLAVTAIAFVAGVMAIRRRAAAGSRR
eukprot:TRINITY_DN50739_c0_g1_i1.p1 TRINITY_DN50739_c0_g1~~TRINITY_DN50739_c0_g1_i1.p1  ORF type:complete len:500 (-),score=88.56 TRINITY_DN50739_c0_g1_i1:82-1431(-)